jgi:hypothetical protein
MKRTRTKWRKRTREGKRWRTEGKKSRIRIYIQDIAYTGNSQRTVKRRTWLANT